MVSLRHVADLITSNENIFSGSPLQPAPSEYRRRPRSYVAWKQPEDNWNITTLPRSILPHLENKNFTHSLPAPGNVQFRVIDADERMLERFHEIKVSLSNKYRENEIYILINFQNNASARTLWGKSESIDSHYSPFFDKALKLLNLQQVAFEIENSVMSKMSCTACKAGATLLQSYIKSGKSKEEIIKTIYQYCVNLRIQSAQVCEGVSQLFGAVSFINIVIFPVVSICFLQTSELINEEPFKWFIRLYFLRKLFMFLNEPTWELMRFAVL